MRSAHILPDYAILFISDVDGGEPPDPERDIPFLSTSSCISFQCSPAVDGGVTVFLGAQEEISIARPPAFNGVIATPTRNVIVSTADQEIPLSVDVTTSQTRVRIWTTGEAWPDRVWIALD